MTEKRVIVTGGAGFIGSHLVVRLLHDGHEIIVLDNFSTGKKENLAQHQHNKKLQIENVDISNFSEVREYFKNIDWVFHLAALADIVPSIQEPLKYHKSNVDGSISVLESSRLANVKRFIYTASSSCYGIPDIYPTPETAEIRIMYPYAQTKLIGEEYAFHWCKVYGIPVISLRIFNAYGTRARSTGTYGAVFGVFLAQKLADKPFTVVGNGTQKRDFVFVSDVIEAFILAAKSNIKNEVFNVGSGKPETVNRLVELLGSNDVIHIPKRPGEPDCTWADISKIKKYLNWQPKIRFEDGVKIMLENIEYWRNAPVWDEKSISEATKEWFYYLSNVKNK